MSYSPLYHPIKRQFEGEWTSPKKLSSGLSPKNMGHNGSRGGTNGKRNKSNLQNLFLRKALLSHIPVSLKICLKAPLEWGNAQLFHSYNILSKRASLSNISTPFKMCLINFYGKFKPDKNETFRFMFQPPKGNFGLIKISIVKNEPTHLLLSLQHQRWYQ